MRAMIYLALVVSVLLKDLSTGLAAANSTWDALDLDHALMELLEQPPGQAQFDKSSHDFGHIFRGEQLEVRFPFHNRGRGPLLIQGVHTRCICVTVQHLEKQVYLPDESGEIVLLLDTTNYLGSFDKSVVVMSSETNLRVHTLSLKAEIMAEIQVDPPLLDFGKVASNLGSHRSLRLSPVALSEPLEIKSLIYNRELFDVAIREDKKGAWLDVYLRPGGPTSFIKENLIIENNSKHLSRLHIPLRVEIESTIAHTPRYVEFGAVSSSRAVERAIRLNSRQNFDLLGQRVELLVNGEKIEDPGRFFEFSGQSIPGDGGQLIKVGLTNKDSLIGSVHGRLVLEISDASQSEISIDFYAFFQE